MRQIGKKSPSTPQPLPSGANFAFAREHQLTGQALMSVATTGIAKGIYRFSSHEEMNRHSDEALARAIAANVRHRARSGA